MTNSTNLIKTVDGKDNHIAATLSLNSTNDSMQCITENQAKFYEENMFQNLTSNFAKNSEKTFKNLPKTDVISMENVSSILGCHCSDLRLILNVASVYSPMVLSSAI